MSSSRNIMYVCLCMHLTFLSAEIKNYFDKTTVHHILIHLFCSRVLILEWAPDKWHQAWSIGQTCRNKITFLQLLPMVCWPKNSWFFFLLFFFGGGQIKFYLGQNKDCGCSLGYSTLVFFFFLIWRADKVTLTWVTDLLVLLFKEWFLTLSSLPPHLDSPPVCPFLECVLLSSHVVIHLDLSMLFF